MRIVRVVWIDSGTFSGESWDSIEHIVHSTKISDVVTVGHLAFEDEDTLYIGLSHDPDHDNFFGVQAILKKSIKFLSDLVLEPVPMMKDPTAFDHPNLGTSELRRGGYVG